MVVFPGFGGWINKNIQQLLKAESETHGNVKPSPVSEKDTSTHAPWFWNPNEDPKKKAEAMQHDHVVRMPLTGVDPKYYDTVDNKRQIELWMHPNSKKHPWYDAPAKVKVRTEKGRCRLKIEFTLGYPPVDVQEMFTNPRNYSYFQRVGGKNLSRLENKSTKVLKKDGPRQITQVEKIFRWEFFRWTIDTPIHLIIDENHQTLTAKYHKQKMIYMKVFEGSWKVEPLYVDQERLCKTNSRISEKEYKKCSSGQGRIGSKVTMEQIFQPSSFLNVPPASWVIREMTIKATKNLLEDFRTYAKSISTNSVW